jgi:hypothetical protein
MPRPRLGERLGEQAGFADPGFALGQHDGQVPGGGPVQGAAEHAGFRFAPVQTRHRRRRGHRADGIAAGRQHQPAR